VNRPRAADDFKMIHARMEELRRERGGTDGVDRDLVSDPPTRPGDRVNPEGPTFRRLRERAGYLR
jgi:hypothetical protein